MRSDIDICNRALRLVRAKVIQSFTDGQLGGVCGEIFPEIRDEVLASYPWNCAMRRESLAQLADAPSFGFSRQYMLPVHCLRVWRVDGDPAWTREGQMLLTDHRGPLFIRYIARIDSGRIDTWVAKVIATKMATELAPSITENVALTERLIAMFSEEFKLAKRLDAAEGTPDVPVENGSWLDSRRG